MSDIENEPEGAVDEVTAGTVIVRRAPRYFRFMLVGGVVGAIVALILTVEFPENSQYDRGQVFGFLLLLCATVGVALGSLIALWIDRRASLSPATVVADRLDVHSSGNSQ
ncbi:hypothetical protein [Luethyella okanaganae]|uniref:Potassium transporter Trk n=1 Tax=Luethyella okanaganae TaxID=69372 RepID=A0ABW1VET4_9MICO